MVSRLFISTLLVNGALAYFVPLSQHYRATKTVIQAKQAFTANQAFTKNNQAFTENMMMGCTDECDTGYLMVVLQCYRQFMSPLGLVVGDSLPSLADFVRAVLHVREHARSYCTSYFGLAQCLVTVPTSCMYAETALVNITSDLRQAYGYEEVFFADQFECGVGFRVVEHNEKCLHDHMEKINVTDPGSNPIENCFSNTKNDTDCGQLVTNFQCVFNAGAQMCNTNETGWLFCMTEVFAVERMFPDFTDNCTTSYDQICGPYPMSDHGPGDDGDGDGNSAIPKSFYPVSLGIVITVIFTHLAQ